MSKHKNRRWQDDASPDSEPSVNPDIDDIDIDDEEPDTQEPEEIPEVKQEETPIIEEPSIINENKEEAMPTTEVKHQEVIPSETTQTEAPKVVAPKKTATTRFLALTKNYMDLARNGIKTEDQKRQAVGILSDIVYLVTTSHDRSVFDACLSFFLSNRAIMLSEQTVVSSVSHYADPTKINRIVQFYVVFTSLVESKILRKRYTININHVRDIFNNKQFAEWLTDKR